MKDNKSKRIGIRLSKIQLRGLNEYCKANHTTKSKFVQNIANYASAHVTIKKFKEPSTENNKRSSVVDSNSRLISSVDRLYRLSKARYRQSAGVAENLNQITKKLNKDYQLTTKNWQYLNSVRKSATINRNDDMAMASAFRKLEKEMS